MAEKTKIVAHVRYKIESDPEGYVDEQLSHEWGGCNKLIIVSVMEGPEPPTERSQMVLSLNGYTGDPLSGDDLFKAWALMAHSLMQHEDLHDTPRGQLCRHVHEAVKAAIKGAQSG